ncbi:MAG: hypothetical protein ACI4XC_06030 [Eubacterium sp.]
MNDEQIKKQISRINNKACMISAFLGVALTIPTYWIILTIIHKKISNDYYILANLNSIVNIFTVSLAIGFFLLLLIPIKQYLQDKYNFHEKIGQGIAVFILIFGFVFLIFGAVFTAYDTSRCVAVGLEDIYYSGDNLKGWFSYDDDTIKIYEINGIEYNGEYRYEKCDRQYAIVVNDDYENYISSYFIDEIDQSSSIDWNSGSLDLLLSKNKIEGTYRIEDFEKEFLNKA